MKSMFDKFKGKVSSEIFGDMLTIAFGLIVGYISKCYLCI